MNRVILRIVGPPTDAGAWPMSAATPREVWNGLPGVGEKTLIRPDPRVVGTVAHVQWHDDRVVLTFEADSLELPAGFDDWRVALAPDVIAEHLAKEVEEFLADGEEWWP
jgi:hypothetical protein